MGQLQLLSPVGYDSSSAVRSLERAVALDPNNPAVWRELVFAYEGAGDFRGSGRAAEKAVELDPRTPGVRWLAANTAILANQPDSALDRLRDVLRLDISYAPAVFSVATRWSGDPAIIESRLMPSENQPELRVRLLEYLAGIGRLDLAPRTWLAVVAAKRAFPFPLVQPYLERLIGAGDAGQAVSVWRDLQALGVISGNDSGNLVFNGDFEHTPLDSGFDWRFSQQPGVWLDFSGHAARLDFVGEGNQDYELIAEIVPVQPATRYVLKARARSDEITSDSGPRLRVSDPACPSCPAAESAGTTGTTPWHPLELDLSTGPRQQFLYAESLRN